jgi:hypothetical protein
MSLLQQLQQHLPTAQRRTSLPITNQPTNEQPTYQRPTYQQQHPNESLQAQPLRYTSSLVSLPCSRFNSFSLFTSPQTHPNEPGIFTPLPE